jgi:SAM-dependent methyltransferase
MKRTRAFYDDDLAYIHDVGFGGYASGAAPGLLDILRNAGIDDGLVVDLGCGSGIWALYLTDAGYDVHGFDIAPAMIALARQRAPAAQFEVGSLFATRLPICRAITSLGEVLCYRSQEGYARDPLPAFFDRAADALMPGGVLVFDIAETGLDKGRAPTFRAGPDWACLLRFEYNDERDQLIRHITSFRKVGELYRRSEEVHRVQLYDRRAIAAMLRKVGFRVRMVRKFGGYSLLPGRTGFIARK